MLAIIAMPGFNAQTRPIAVAAEKLPVSIVAGFKQYDRLIAYVAAGQTWYQILAFVARKRRLFLNKSSHVVGKRVDSDASLSPCRSTP